MATIGQKLEETRVQRGLTVEDVAHQTRIPRHTILAIEDDDFSRFPSVAYAKSFLRKYSEHLGVDLSATLGALDSANTRLADNPLMGEMKRTIKKDRLFHFERFGRRPRRIRTGKAGRAPLLLNLILLLLMAFLAIFYFLGFNAPNAQQAQRNMVRGLGFEVEPETPAPPAPAPASEKSTQKVPAPPAKPVLQAFPVSEPLPGPSQSLPAPRPRADGAPDPAAELPGKLP